MTCAQSLLVFWNPHRVAVFVLNEEGKCINVMNGTASGYIGQTADEITCAMLSVMRYRNGTEIGNGANGHPRVDRLSLMGDEVLSVVHRIGAY